MQFIRGLSRRPVRQAYVWAAVGVLGLAFAAAGISLLTRDDDDNSSRSGTDRRDPTGAAASPTSTVVPTPTLSPSPEVKTPTSSPSSSASETASPTAIATATSQSQQNPNTGASQATAVPPPPTPVPPTPVPTSLPAASRSFCNTTSSSAPPFSLFGLLTIGGQPGPAGTIVTATFDGVPGPTVATTAAASTRGARASFRMSLPPSTGFPANIPG